MIDKVNKLEYLLFLMIHFNQGFLNLKLTLLYVIYSTLSLVFMLKIKVDQNN